MKTNKHIITAMLAIIMVSTGCNQTEKQQKNDNEVDTIAKKNDDVGLYPIDVNGKTGYIDATGKIVINPQFDMPFCDYDPRFSDGRCLVGINDNHEHCYIDKKGNIVIKPQFDKEQEFSEGLALVDICGKAGFIDTTGKYVINPQFEDAGDFHEGLALAGNWNNIGFIDKTGNYVIDPQFEDAGNFNEGLAWVSAGEYPNYKYGFINKTGNPVIKPQFEWVSSFSEGLACVRVGEYPNHKYGFIDKTGNLVIKPQFDVASDFSEGLAVVGYRSQEDEVVDSGPGYVRLSEEKYTYGFIDKTGTFVINPQFSWAYPFIDELAPVHFDGKFHYIDKNGIIVWTSDHRPSDMDGFYQNAIVDDIPLYK